MTNPNAHTTYSFADIQRYLSGGMTAKEMHELEKAALQDPFLADAIEGYRNADTTLAAKHLNEITAALQKEEPAKVISMPRKKSYGWLVAASLLAVIAAGIFLFTDQNKSSAPLASNNIKKEKAEALPAEDSKAVAPQADSPSSASSGNIALAKPEKKEDNSRMAMLEKKQSSADKQITVTSQAEEDRAPGMAMAAPVPSTSSADMDAKQMEPRQALPDSINTNQYLSQEVVVASARRQKKLTSTWTTDKGKPFLLSDVEVINLGSKKRKRTDTSAIQPEGGWQAFQDYLFSRLSRHDSLLLVTNNLAPDNVELEFSVDKSGLPYDIQVRNTQDTMVTNKIVNAIQSGPKWKSNDTKEKRLRIRY